MASSKAKLFQSDRKCAKRFTRQVFIRNSLFEISYPERLARLSTTTLPLRRVIYDQNLVFRNISDHLDIDFTSFPHSTALTKSTNHIQRNSRIFFGSYSENLNKLPASIPNTSLKTYIEKLECFLKQKAYL